MEAEADLRASIESLREHADETTRELRHDLSELSSVVVDIRAEARGVKRLLGIWAPLLAVALTGFLGWVALTAISADHRSQVNELKIELLQKESER